MAARGLDAGRGRAKDPGRMARLRDLALDLYTSPTLHRMVPAPLAVAVVGTVEPRLRRLRNPAEEADATRLMSDLLHYTPRADEVAVVTRRHLRERCVMRELFWRPELLRHSRIIDPEHWDAAHRDGGGCVMVLGHFGGSWAVPGILQLHGYDVHMVASAHLWDEQPSGLVGREHTFLREYYGEGRLGSARMVPNDAPPERVTELVASGATVGIAFDVPGSASTPFLGRSVALTSGPASVAFHTGAKLLPVITERDGTRLDVRMLAPIDPADHRDLRALRATIARTYEPFVIARPEMVENAWYPSPLVTEAPATTAPAAET